MGVMSCSRRGCDNIMCQTYIDSVGYICSECQNEFKDYIDTNNIILKTEGEITRELSLFMKTTKDLYKEGEEITVDQFFSKNTN